MKAVERVESESHLRLHLHLLTPKNPKTLTPNPCLLLCSLLAAACSFALNPRLNPYPGPRPYTLTLQKPALHLLYTGPLRLSGDPQGVELK